MNNKILFTILDGAADIPDKNGNTPLSIARKPYLDMLAKHSHYGLWQARIPSGYNIASATDLTTLQMLGCADYPGRGYLEALGIGLQPNPGSVCLRANFATVNEKRNIIDRRAGRDEKGLDELASAVNELKIEDVKFSVYRSVGHRAVVVAEGKNLSAKISDSDLGGEIRRFMPLDGSKSAKKTADVLNNFAQKAYDILSRHPVNKKRKIPANFLLMRGAGMPMKTQPFHKHFGLRAASISAVGIIKGISRFLDIDVINVKGATGHLNTNLEEKLNETLSALIRYDLVILHINGADEAGHDKNFEAKKSFIERIDEIIFKEISTNRNLNIVVTSDHITNSKTGQHTPGPVPLIIYDTEEVAEGIESFNEKNCSEGFITDNPMEKVLVSLRRK